MYQRILMNYKNHKDWIKSYFCIYLVYLYLMLPPFFFRSVFILNWMMKVLKFLTALVTASFLNYKYEAARYLKTRWRITIIMRNLERFLLCFTVMKYSINFSLFYLNNSHLFMFISRSSRSYIICYSFFCVARISICSRT